MSSSDFLLSLDIDRPACYRVPVLVCLGAVLALVAVNLGGLAWQLKLLLSIASPGCGLWESRRHWPGSADAVSHLQAPVAGPFLLGRAGDPHVRTPARLAHWWALPQFAIGMEFVDGAGRRRAVVLFRDRLPPEVWRRLLVRLRHGAQPGP